MTASIHIYSVRLHRSSETLELCFKDAEKKRASFVFTAALLHCYNRDSQELSLCTGNKMHLIITAFSCCQTEGLTLSFNDGLIAVIGWQQLYQLGLENT